MKVAYRTARIGVLLLAALTGFLSGALAAQKGGTWGDPRKLSYPPLHEIQVPEPERFVLDNGMIVYLLEDHDFPLVDARALMRVGSVYDPPEKVGLAAITSEVMRTGGTTEIPGDSLDVLLESMGASIEFNMRNTEATASVSTLAEDFPQGLSILAGLLRRPALPEEKLELEKNAEKTSIASRNDESMDILFRELPKLIYGPDHPYARNTEYATIDAIERQDLVDFHDKYFHPDRIILTVYGDFRSQQVKDLLRKEFGDWPRSTTPLPADPPVVSAGRAGLYLANKPDATNTVVVLGQIGMRRDDPDYPAMAVLNEIIGGGFSSRLMNEIRTKRGLAYDAGSSVGAGYHHPGAMVFYAVTQVDSTVVTADYVLQEVAKVLNQEVTPEELNRARDAILNSLVFTLSSKGAVLNRLAQYEFYGYPPDFLQKYQEAVRNVTAADILAAAKRKIHPPEFVTLFVGSEDKIAPGIPRDLYYQALDISIPEPPGAGFPPATAEDFSRGQKMLARAVAAVGKETLEGIRTFKTEQKGLFTIEGSVEFPFEVTSTRRLPDCVRMDQKMPSGLMVQAMCGGQGWLQNQRGAIQLPYDQAKRMRESLDRDLLSVLRSAATLKVQALADTTIDGRALEVVGVHHLTIPQWKIYFDKKSGLVFRMEYRAHSPKGSGGFGIMQENFVDYHEDAGLKWPHGRTVSFEGTPFANFTTTSITLNEPIDEGFFEMPEGGTGGETAPSGPRG